MKLSKIKQQLLVFIVLVILGILLGIGSSRFFLEEQVFIDNQEGVDFNPSANYSILIDKSDLQLTLFADGEVCRKYFISDGKNSGDKQKVGDCRTPIGDFEVISIEPSAEWTYDFEDDEEGPIVGAYGPYFMRLNTSWKGIGIHGTHNESWIGFHNSHGCIRLKNSDIIELKSFVTINTPVKIVE